MEESACHEMVIHIPQRFSSMCFCTFFISFKYDFHVDAERMIVKTRELLRNICVDGLKNNVWHDTPSLEKNCRYL